MTLYRLLSAAALTAFLPAMAQAQTAPAAPQAGLEEIVVTAQKREQNLQSVPVAVTALSGDALASKNVATVSDLPRLAPSLTVTQGNVPTNNSINLRGIGTSAFSTGIEPSVAVIVDDVALLQQAQAFSGLSDIARIEVLRGPQGTLFGKNSSAGAINIVTRGASKVLSGGATLRATTDEEYRVDATLAGPLGDNIGFRINGFYGDRKGYINNLTDGRRFNNDASYGLRGRLEIRPAAGLKIDLIAGHSVSSSNGTARTFLQVPTGATVFGAAVAPSIADIAPGYGNYAVRIDGPLYNKSVQSTFIGKASYDLGFADLVSITSYQDWKFRFAEDFDYLTGTVLGLSGGIVANSTYHATQFTQELRLVSPARKPLTYVLGLFYSDGATTRTFDRGPSGPVVARWSSRSGTISYAAFGQATYSFLDRNHIDVGLRYNHEKVSADFINLVPNASPPAANATCLATCSGVANDGVVTTKVALRRDLADGVMGYVSYARGYKGQGFDISSGFTPRRAANPVKPETSNAYEIGLKSRFLDNRLQLNVAAFWSDFNNFQAQSGILLPDNTIQLTLNNVGRVRTRGVEIELSAKPTPALRLDGSVSYTEAMIRSFPGAQCYTGQTVGCVDLDGAGPSTTTGQDLSGKRLANAPRLKFNIGGTYTIALPKAAFDGFVQLDYNYQSRVNFDLLQNPLTQLAPYGVLNASFGITPKGRGVALTVFVNNVFDKHYASNIAMATGGSIGLLSQTLGRDSRRYAGLKAHVEF
ncbi:TonB-dependent receptor [Novosphingobium sp. FSY-8]|uniref:TonB-dependent receptor n=1 Tax=Novosphingobium ovatum TaxID=1908523 RepID=A0ABW9X999_9SPHN|nr:TonB-dependent receptor [Novosphingobium ovatum]NBC35090.1 TonB-dependent receptor [Novosphingobium ovatum]